MTVGELRARVSAAEMVYWRAAYSLDPWGEQRADMRLAQVCALLANQHRDTTKRPKPYSVEDFMLFPERDPEARRQRDEALNLRAHMQHLLRAQQKES